MTETTTLPTTTTFFLEDGYEHKLQERLDFLNKKCKRFGLDPVTVSFGDFRTEKILITPAQGRPIEMTIRGRNITVDVREIGLPEGWAPVAMLESAGDGKHNIVSGDVDGLDRFKTLDLKTCDHCGCKHNRKKSYVVSNGEVEKVVGSTCIKDYLGISADAFLSLLDAFRNLGVFGPPCDEDGEPIYSGPREPVFHDLESFISDLVQCLIFDDFKYISGKQAREDWSGCTSSTVASCSYLFNMKRKDYDSDMKILKEKIEKSGIDVEETVKEILAMLKGEYTEERIITEQNAFDYNMCIAVVNGFYPDKSSRMVEGSLAYKVFRFLTTDSEKSVHPKKTDSEFFGSVKEKIEANVTVTFTRSVSSFYGESLMVVGYVNETSNYFVTFLSGDASFLTDAEQGKLRIRATVKGHKDGGQYGKQTQLTRMRLAGPKADKKVTVLN